MAKLYRSNGGEPIECEPAGQTCEALADKHGEPGLTIKADGAVLAPTAQVPANVQIIELISVPHDPDAEPEATELTPAPPE